MVTHAELEQCYRKEKDSRVKERLLAMCHVVINKESYADVARMLFKVYNTIKSWHKRFLKHGIKGLNDLPRSGRPPKVTNEKITKYMRGYGSRLIFISELIQTVYQCDGVLYTPSGMRSKARACRYSRKTPEPIHIRKDKVGEVIRWQRHMKPWISGVERAKFLLMVADQTIVAHDYYKRRGPWSPVGQRIHAPYFGSHQNTVVFGAVSRYNDQAFMSSPWFNKEETVRFLRLLLNRHDKVALILDRAGPHRSRMVSNFIQDNSDRLRVEYFPTGWPDLNATEECWNIFKQQPFMQQVCESVDDRIYTMMEFLRTHRFNVDVLKHMFTKPIAKTF